MSDWEKCTKKQSPLNTHQGRLVETHQECNAILDKGTRLRTSERSSLLLSTKGYCKDAALRVFPSRRSRAAPPRAMPGGNRAETKASSSRCCIAVTTLSGWNLSLCSRQQEC